MPAVSQFRLHLLRAMYLFVAGGLLLLIWPGLVRHGNDVPLMSGIVSAMLGAVSILAAFGLRYPLQMLPILLFELIWKSIWLFSFALPLWVAGEMDPRTMKSVWDCLVGVVLVPLALPWRYILYAYFARRGDRWRSGDSALGDAARPRAS